MPVTDPLIASIKTIRRGKSIQQEGEFRLRQMLPNLKPDELTLVAGSIERLIVNGEAEATEIAPEPTPTKRQYKKRAKTKPAGKPFKRDKILKSFLGLKVQPYTSPELAKACGLASAQPLSPLLTSLKRNQAMKRRVKDGEITWEPIRKGLKHYIKACAEEAA